MFLIQHRRRRENKTDYHSRLALVKSGKARIVIRKSLAGINVQFINYKPEGDATIVAAVPAELNKYGWKASSGNLPAAYLVGLIAGMKAKKKGIKEAVLDMGLQSSTKGSRIYAALKGAVDAGINIPHSAEILPDENRLKGAHISNYSRSVKDRKVIFSKYNVKPEDITTHFEEVKKKIMLEK